MGKVDGSITVAVPVERAFAFLADWRHVASYQSALADYHPISQRTQGEGARFACKLVTARGDLDAEVLVSDYRQSAGFTLTTTRGPRQIEHWSLASAGPGQTEITYAIDYPIPKQGGGGILNLLMLKGVWRRRVSEVLRKLKELLEQNAAAPAY